MSCIKTGAQVYLVEYDMLVYGDAYDLAGVLVLRIVASARRENGRFTPLRPQLHFRVKGVSAWFDREQTDRPSTLTSAPGWWEQLGSYDGVLLQEILR